MKQEVNWKDVIIYHDILYEHDAIYWIPSNKIYVYNLVKNYDVFHEYILEHEKIHYKNYNCNRHYFLRIMLDILNEWKGAWKNTFNKKLKNDKEKYVEELSKIKEDKKVINNMDELRYKLGEIKPIKNMLIYSKVVGFFRPDNKAFILILWLLILVELIWVLNIFCGIDLVQWVREFILA